jgi:hypothetical protein
MNYTEFKNTYKALLKSAPSVSNVYNVKDIMVKITHYIKKGSRWIIEDEEEKNVDYEFYCNTADPGWSSFMRSLGGYEKTERNYTKYGFIPVRFTSISPAKDTKTVRQFIF